MADWLPDDFEHPHHVEVIAGYHLRPIRATDVDIDFPAVMGSRDRLWARYGDIWGWPPATMTYEQDEVDLARHETEIATHQSFNYALLVDDESALVGCVYIDPPVVDGYDAEVSWWVVDDLVGSDVAGALDDLVPRWLAADWPLVRPRIGPSA